MTENPTRNDNPDGPRPPKPPDADSTSRRREMIQEAVASTKANRLEKELGFDPSVPETKPAPTESNRKNPPPPSRGLELRPPSL